MMEAVFNLLPLLAILWPLALLAICALPGSGRGLTPWLASAPLPAMLAALFSNGRSLTLSPSSVMPFTLEIDTPGAVLLGVCTLLWAAAALGLPRQLAGSPHRRRFTACWLLTLIGSLGVFMAADVMGFFVFYALVSLPAYGLVIHEETAESKRAGSVYLGFALLGEALLLMGFVLLALNPSGGGLHIAEAVATLPESPWQAATMLLLVAGFGLKIGLLPGHGWMPLAYTALPTAAAAALSGAAVKAGVIGLIRFAPFEAETPAGIWLLGLGFLGAFYGVAVGLTQRNAKTVLAYSSVSQMGFMAAVCGMAMVVGNAAIALPLAFYAAHHTLVKGGLFLAYGCAETRGNGRFPAWALPALLIGLGLAGLPFTGGALAKLAVKDGLGDGLAGWLSIASAAATACLMMHFFLRLATIKASSTGFSRSLLPMATWLLVAAGAVAVPWLLQPMVETISLGSSLTAPELWKATWPVALGALLGWQLERRSVRLPRIPAGDILSFGPLLRGPARVVASRLESCDQFLRHWSVGGAILVGLATGLALLLRFGNL